MIHHEIILISKGGGYMRCKTRPIHPRADVNGYRKLHRTIIENNLGRYLNDDEHVHHIDGNKYNNDLSNLEVLNNSEHGKRHHSPLPLVNCICAECGSHFQEIPRFYRLRIKRNKNGKLCCYRKCASKFQFKNQAAECSSGSFLG